MKFYVHFVKKARMASFLSHTGYFRCSRYGKFLLSRANMIGTKPSQDMLFHLYSFDTKLRELLFHYCQLAEIQFKTYLSDSISLKLEDSAYYMNPDNYTPSRSEREKIRRQSNLRYYKSFFNHLKHSSKLLIENSQKYPELKEYRKGGTKFTSYLPSWVFYSYSELGTVVNIYAYLRGDLRSHVLKHGYSRNHYGKSTTKQFDTWLEALRNLRNICAHHNILVGKTSSVVLPEPNDAHVLVSDTDLFSRIYALKKVLPPQMHNNLKKDLSKLIKKSKLDIIHLAILPENWEKRFDNIILL